MRATSSGLSRPDGTRPPKDTWRNIERTGEFVIHVVSDALGHQMNLTARELPYGTDEIAETGLTKVPCDKIAPPRIAEAPVAMECKLERIVEIGRSGTAVIIGEILLWHVRDDLIVDGRIDPHRLDAIGRMGGASYVRTRDLFDMARQQQILDQIADQKRAHPVEGEALPHFGSEQESQPARIAEQGAAHASRVRRSSQP